MRIWHTLKLAYFSWRIKCIQQAQAALPHVRDDVILEARRKAERVTKYANAQYKIERIRLECELEFAQSQQKLLQQFNETKEGLTI